MLVLYKYVYLEVKDRKSKYKEHTQIFGKL